MALMIDNLKKNIKGKVIVPGDLDYDQARKIYNGMIDKHPAIIVKCAHADDVIEAVNFGKANQMEVSIKSGGHNGAGLSLVEGGLVIDLSEMKEIEINPGNKTAKIQPGNTIKDVDKATHEFGLALPVGIVASTGIGGLTLGGGIGYLSRKAGLTIDHLVEAEVVLADGRLVVTNADSHPDLFWAIRGGGGNFGVIVSFTFTLVPVKNIYGGPMFWSIEQAPDVMKFYARHTKDANEDLYGFFAFLVVPPAPPFPENLHNKNLCGVVWCYTGPAEKRDEVFKPIRDFGPPVLDMVGEMPMPALNSMFDELYPPGMQWYWKANYIKELSDEAIQEAVKHGSKIPSMHSTTHFYPIDGKVHDVGAEETAWANRDARWAHVIVGVDPDAANAAKVTKWCREYYDAMVPYASGGAYVNFMMEEGNERIQLSYGINYDRLVAIKKEYDPNNFFHVNQNIQPHLQTG